MESSQISQLEFIRILKNKNIALFDINDIRKLFPLKSDNTLKHLLRRLKKKAVIKDLKRGKYLFLHSQKSVSEFETANFLVVPSYISLESALSFYGIIEQFPYSITSITIKKSQEITVGAKQYRYSTIKKNYFKDFTKMEDFVIAQKEKAIFDYLYFIFKGQKAQNKIEDFKRYMTNDVKKYFSQNAEANFLNFVKKYVKL